ncbi:MAG: ABC transporter ATP-binding protein [Armatimonadota bacterium]|nr:ABC transporter ATP-binding protein [Armatimonadota bacterium]
MLTVEHLEVFYGHMHAVRDVGFEVKRGELVAIIGANGAGKSSIIRAIVGWVSPRAGRVVLNGAEITRRPPWERAEAGIGLVPEGKRLFPALTVEENLRMGAYLRRGADLGRALDEVYGLFPVLRDRRRQLAKTLSGGEQQMLAIGRALVSRPSLLLVDEVSTGLMPTMVDRVLEVLRRLRDRGITVLLVEQNARAALRVADRGYVLEVGRIILSGPAADLRQHPSVVAAYLGGAA